MPTDTFGVVAAAFVYFPQFSAFEKTKAAGRRFSMTVNITIARFGASK